MNKIKDIINLINASPLTDIWLVGFLDEGANSYKVFHPMQDNVYLEFGKSFYS